MTTLRKPPQFKALEGVYGALAPLDPEGRRKVIEAIHSLLKISEGTKGSRGSQGPGEGKGAARSNPRARK